MKKLSKADIVFNYVSRKIEYLEKLADSGPGKAAFANLRRGVGKRPGELPELWGIIFEGIPEELLGKREISHAEWAIYTTLTLYACHRQGCDVAVNKKDISVGRAAAKLVKDKEDEGRILNRLNLVVTAATPDDMAYHLRSVVQLLSNEGISLDYARLAKELYLINHEDDAYRIKLNWGRDFYSERYNDNKLNEEKKENLKS